MEDRFMCSTEGGLMCGTEDRLMCSTDRLTCRTDRPMCRTAWRPESSVHIWCMTNFWFNEKGWSRNGVLTPMISTCTQFFSLLWKPFLNSYAVSLLISDLGLLTLCVSCISLIPLHFCNWHVSGDFFAAAFNCPHEVERLGALGDGGKWVCGLSCVAKKPDCVVYSFGKYFQTSFFNVFIKE